MITSNIFYNQAPRYRLYSMFPLRFNLEEVCNLMQYWKCRFEINFHYNFTSTWMPEFQDETRRDETPLPEIIIYNTEERLHAESNTLLKTIIDHSSNELNILEKYFKSHNFHVVFIENKYQGSSRQLKLSCLLSITEKFWAMNILNTHFIYLSASRTSAVCACTL